MNALHIPQPKTPSDEPSDFSKMEMADLSATKRNTVLYERNLAVFERHNKFLTGQIEKLQTDIQSLAIRDSSYTEAVSSVAMLERAQIEMAVSFALATVGMAVGGGLISSFPNSPADTPWQFVLGWALMLSGVVFGFTSRVIVWASVRIKENIGN